MRRYDFRPLTEQEKKMSDPAVRQALRVLFTKGITFEQVKESYQYFDSLKCKKVSE